MFFLVLLIVAGVIGGIIGAWYGAGAIRTASIAKPAAPPPRGGRNDLLQQALRPSSEREAEPVVREERRVLEEMLADVARQHEAEGAVLWRLSPSADAPNEVLAESGRSSATMDEAQQRIIRWAAEAGVISFDRTDGAPALAVVIVPLEEGVGALSLHAPSGLQESRDSLKGWLPRHAARMGALTQLVRTRSELARQNRQLRALVRTAQTLQGTRDPLALERLLVDAAMEVVGADWAWLVRWDREAKGGALRARTRPGPEQEVGTPVHEGSLAVQVAEEGMIRVWEDARALTAGNDSLVGDGPLPVGLASLLIAPVRRSDAEAPLGVLLCGSSEVGRLRVPEGRVAQSLGVIAAGALETAWAVEEASQKARTDQLTGLANRREFHEQFARTLTETDRFGGSCALVLMDVDHFKKVNDSFGHEAGDAVLVALAQALSEGRRAVDLVARLGGEELAMVLPQTDEVGALELAERLRARIEALVIRTGGREIKVTASFGVVLHAARGTDRGTLFERADKALYRAKAEGRNRVVLAAAGK